MRFVHIADVHLDTPFLAWSSGLRRRLRDASRTAFRGAVDLALRERVDSLLVAGDLFDGERLSFETERFLGTELARLGEAGIQVFYATGNHDPADDEAQRERVRWPSHVHRFLGPPRTLPVTDGEGRTVGTVTGAGHATRRVTEDLSAAFPPPSAGIPSVALLHTQVRSSRTSELHEPYAPSDLERLVKAGFDYWALGHVHSRQCLYEEPAVHYPGNTQGRTPRETGAKGGLLVELTERSGARATFHPLGPVRWEDLLLPGLGDVSDLAGLISLARDRWEAERERDPGAPGTDWIVQVKLAGPCPLWSVLGREEELEALTDELRGALGAISVRVWPEKVHRPVDPHEHRGRPDVLGVALDLVREVHRGAPVPGLAADDLAGYDSAAGGSPEDYVRSLLDDAEAMLASRLLRPTEGGP